MHGKYALLQEILSDSVSPIRTSAPEVSSLISYMDGCSICYGNSDEKVPSAGRSWERKI